MAGAPLMAHRPSIPDSRRPGADLLALFGSLVATQAVTSAIGFVYWIAAARLFPAAQVGLAAAAISAMSLVSFFAMLGVGTLLISEMPRRSPSEHPVLLGTGLLTVALAGSLLGLAAGAVAPHLGRSLVATGNSPLALLAFAVGVTATAVGAVFDEAVLGLHRGSVQLARNTFASVLKLALLVGLSYAGLRSGGGIIATWSLSLLLSIAFGFLRLRLGQHGPWWTPARARIREIRFQLPNARRHYSLNLILQSSGYMLPFLVSLVALPREVAYFNTARLIAGALLALPFMLTVALFAATADDESRLNDRIRTTVPLGLILASCCAALAIVLGGEVMRVFGAAYARNGVESLRLLVLAGPPLVIKDHYVAIRRVQGQLSQAAWVILVATILEATAALVGGFKFGVTGLCLGWLLALVLEAFWTGPVVVRAMKRRGTMSGTS